MKRLIRDIRDYLGLFIGFWFSFFLSYQTRRDLKKFSQAILSETIKLSLSKPDSPWLGLEGNPVYKTLEKKIYQVLKQVYAVCLLWPSGEESPAICSSPVCISSTDQGDLYVVFIFAGKKILEGEFVSFDLFLKGYALGNSPDQAIKLSVEEL